MRAVTPLVIIALASLAPIACDEGGGGSDILIATSELEDARVQLPYLATLEAADASGEIEWALTGGELPPGLALTSDGRIEGTPTASGRYSFFVEADDGEGTDEVELEISVPPVVLMSGFEPFGGYDTNPSWEALIPLHLELVAGLDVRTIELPVTWAGGWAALEEEISRLHADVVIATGMAGTYAMRFETNAVNLANGSDNDEVAMNNEEIVEGGPASLSDSLPVEEMAAAMEAGGHATTVSDDAGDFLCNHVFYNLMYWIDTTDDHAPSHAGFIHVPPAPYQGPITVEEITAAHRLGLEALAEWLDADRARAAVVPTEHDAPLYFF